MIKQIKNFIGLLGAGGDLAFITLNNYDEIKSLQKELCEIKKQLASFAKNQDMQIPVTVINTLESEPKTTNLKKNSVKKNEKKAPKNTKKV